MKKNKIILIIVFMMGILLLGTNFYQENKTVTSKKDVKEYIDFGLQRGFFVYHNIEIIKTDENGQPMNVSMRLVSPNESSSYPVQGLSGNIYSGDVNYQLDIQDEITQEVMNSYLSREQREALASIHTPQDLEDIFGVDKYYCYEEETHSSGNDTYHYPAECYVYLPTVYKLEETEVPNGFSKKKIYIPGLISITYEYPNLGENEAPTSQDEIAIKAIETNSITNGYYMEYGTVSKEELQGLDLDATMKIWKRKGISQGCANAGIFQTAKIARQGISSNTWRFFDGDYCPLELVNEQGEVKLDITLSVNDKVTVTSDIEQQLEFKVSVNNIGSLDAYDNTVRAKLPEGFKYVDGSASNQGTYQDGFITWTVDMLKEGENINLTYKAYAPKGINVNDSFIGEAVVVNDSIEGNYVEANKTYVKLSLNNPKTYTPIGIIILVLVLSGIGLGSVLKKGKQK